jgi:hypothetical protein
MFFVQKRLRLVWIAGGPGRSEKSMNPDCIGKTKFAAQFHVDPKQKSPSLHTENQALGKK